MHPSRIIAVGLATMMTLVAVFLISALPPMLSSEATAQLPGGRGAPKRPPVDPKRDKDPDVRPPRRPGEVIDPDVIVAPPPAGTVPAETATAPAASVTVGGGVAVTAQGDYVYVVRGNMLYQFNAKDLRLVKKAPLE